MSQRATFCALQEWQRLLYRSMKLAEGRAFAPGDPSSLYAPDEAYLASLPPALQARCNGTVGTWCGKYYMQKPLPPKVGLPCHGCRRTDAQRGCHGCLPDAAELVRRWAVVGNETDRPAEMVRRWAVVENASTWLSAPCSQAPLHGNKKCANDCNGVGNCQADYGYCQCTAGLSIVCARRAEMGRWKD
jgi:hypothetical protein